MKIYCTDKDLTLSYAADELVKYLRMMGNDAECSDAPADNAIALGTLSSLGLSAEGVDDPLLDEITDISVVNGVGYIAGSDTGAALRAVYAYLKAAGCTWVRPGRDGEYIPKRNMREFSLSVRHRADYPIRGEVIEGAISLEHVLDTLVFSPKVGYNSFMMQFTSPYDYLRRWHEHRLNPRLAPEALDDATLDRYTYEMEMTAKRCGLKLHSLGHGFLLGGFGIFPDGKPHPEGPSPKVEPYLALVRGKRGYYQNYIKYTHLCYSNEEARKSAVEYLVSYMKKKPYVDVLHVWLADSFNNLCECENCTLYTSDYYTILLNELDRRLAEEKIDTRIAICIYVDTFWPPRTVRFNNPSRFMMITSMQRDHNIPLSSEAMPKDKLPKYVKNQYRLKPTCDMILGFREAWREHLDVPTFTFDYDLYSTHYYDPGYFQISRLIYEDVKAYPEMELLGRLSCQSQRCAFPTALPNALLGELLTDSKLDFDAYVDRYFHAAFGKRGEEARAYLEKITELFCPEQLRNNESLVELDTKSELVDGFAGYIGNPRATERLKSIPSFIDAFLPTIREGMCERNETHRKSWELLLYHAELCRRYSRVFAHLSERHGEEAKSEALALGEWLSENELALAPHFDVYLFLRRLDVIVGHKRAPGSY